jgi:hypothetical protein
MASDQRFQAAGSYSLISPPRTGRRWILRQAGSGQLRADQRREESGPQLPLLPEGLVVAESFDEAVDLVELAPALAASDGQERVTHWELTFVLMAMTSRYALTRLRMVLDHGPGYGVTAVLLG